MASINEFVDNQDAEIKHLGKSVANCIRDLYSKFDKSDAKELWSNFENYARYEDLKDHYKKTIPELAKFEQKLINFHDDLERKSQIIAEFDKTLSMKCNKNFVLDVVQRMEKDYALLNDVNEMRSKMVKDLGDWTNKLNEQQQVLEMMSKSLKSQIQRELKAVTN